MKGLGIFRLASRGTQYRSGEHISGPRATIPDGSAKFRLRGVVENENKALMPHAIIRVLRADSAPSKREGKFALHLDEGDYVAMFDYQGFGSASFASMGNDGWQGVELAMVVDDSSNP